MDLLWLVLVLVGIAVVVSGFVWFRKHQLGRACDGLGQAKSVLKDIEGAGQPYVRTGDYMPESVRRNLDASVIQLTQHTLPPIAKVVRRRRDSATREQLEDVLRHASELQQLLQRHNGQYVQRKVTEHS